jgi:hypothetical protein
VGAANCKGGARGGPPLKRDLLVVSTWPERLSGSNAVGHASAVARGLGDVVLTAECRAGGVSHPRAG